MEPKGVRVLTRVWTWFVLAFLYVPLLVIGVYAFNKDRIPSFPPDLFTLHWFRVVWSDPSVAPGIRAALANSLVAGISASLLALVLGPRPPFRFTRFPSLAREA